MPKKQAETNPFVQALEIKAIYRLESEGEDKEEGAAQEIYKVRKIDRDEHISVYTTGLLGWFSDLPSSAKDMVMYICAHLRYEREVIEITEEDYCEVMRVSRATYYSAKQALTNRLIIPRTSRNNTYWINPTYIFKGNRIKLYPEKVVMVNEHPIKSVTQKKETPDYYNELLKPSI